MSITLRRGATLLLLAAVAILLWAVLVLVAALDGWGRTALAPAGDVAAFTTAARQRVLAENRGNVVLVVLRDGRVVGEAAASVGVPVNRQTLFQVASVSKWLTAVGVLALVDQGKLELDAPIGRYLSRWSLPPSEYDVDGVTVRRLLSHTAGLTDGLGYGGFSLQEQPQSLEESLTLASDRSPGADGRVRVGAAPGGEWRYSGGGYALLQLAIEEVTDERFATYMQRTVFAPLGMHRTVFAVPVTDRNVAEIYDQAGRVVPPRQFTARAAAGLYTSAADLVEFLRFHRPGSRGEPPGRGVVRPSTLDRMRAPHATLYGADIWGLGAILFAPLAGGGFVIGHDGDNEPAINAAVRLDPATGDGIIVLATGTPLLATTIASEWTFWHSGAVDVLDVQRGLSRTLAVFVGGVVVILTIAVWLGWKTSAGPIRSLA